MVEWRASDSWRLGWQQRGDPRPLLVGQCMAHSLEDLHLRVTGLTRHQSSAASSMTRLGYGLMVATECGPGQMEGETLGRLDEREEETPDLGHGQREEFCGPPFSTPFAARRVTSRNACASSDKVMWRCQAFHFRTSY